MIIKYVEEIELYPFYELSDKQYHDGYEEISLTEEEYDFVRNSKKIPKNIQN